MKPGPPCEKCRNTIWYGPRYVKRHNEDEYLLYVCTVCNYERKEETEDSR